MATLAEKREIRRQAISKIRRSSKSGRLVTKAVRKSAKTLDLHGAYIPRTSLRHASLRNANLTNTNLSGADLSGSDLRGAILENADLRGANLTAVKNLTAEQLQSAKVDAHTRLPDYLTPER
ncbi:MAG: pentapeptide repeat-containing protein [Pseudomonadota bacterium]